MAITVSPHFAVHPGEWLRAEIVAPHGLSVTELARHFGVSRQAMSTLLNGRVGLGADMAIRFEKAFGLSADTLLRMQTQHDLALARRRQDGIKVARLPESLGTRPSARNIRRAQPGLPLHSASLLASTIVSTSESIGSGRSAKRCFRPISNRSLKARRRSVSPLCASAPASVGAKTVRKKSACALASASSSPSR